jgi:DNA-binding response OmpR family regulator
MEIMRKASAEKKRFVQNALSTSGAGSPEPGSPTGDNADGEAAAHAGPPHILLAQDDPAMGKLLPEYLAQQDFRVTTLADANGLPDILGKEVVELVLLDLKLAAQDTMELVRRLRETSPIPIVMLGGRSEEADRVMALELGADDYMTKPFSRRELVARLRAILRRRRLDMDQGRVTGVRAYRFEGWQLNVDTRYLWSPDGRQHRLTNGEFSLLEALLSGGERVHSRAQLLALSRLHDDEVYDRAIDVQIMRLRRKLENAPAKPRYILTERGAGYRFGVPVERVY